jgi:hypothetical protein
MLAEVNAFENHAISQSDFIKLDMKRLAAWVT